MKTIFLTIFLSIVGCGTSTKSETKAEFKEGWTETRMDAATDGCTDSLSSAHPDNERITLKKSKEICTCLIKKISQNYTSNDFVYFTDRIIQDLIKDGSYKACTEASGLEWDEVRGIHLAEILNDY
mgnify:CR=1 FL=1